MTILQWWYKSWMASNYSKFFWHFILVLHLHMSRLMTKPTKWLCAQRRLWSAWASAILLVLSWVDWYVNMMLGCWKASMFPTIYIHYKWSPWSLLFSLGFFFSSFTERTPLYGTYTWYRCASKYKDLHGTRVISSQQSVYLSLVMRKPAFGVCDQVRLKPACSASETS